MSNYYIISNKHYVPKTILSIFTYLFLNVYFSFEREADRWTMSRGGVEREGDTESEAGSRP